MIITRRMLERDMPKVLALLKQNQGEKVEVIDRTGELLFYILWDATINKVCCGNDHSIPYGNAHKQNEATPTEQIQTTPTREEALRSLKKSFGQPMPTQQEQIVPTKSAVPEKEVVGRKDKKYRVLGQSPYGRDDIKYTTSFGA